MPIEILTKLSWFWWGIYQELQDRVAKAKDFDEELIQIRKEIVDFHGEMVLLENYSALNYTGNRLVSMVVLKSK